MLLRLLLQRVCIRTEEGGIEKTLPSAVPEYPYGLRTIRLPFGWRAPHDFKLCFALPDERFVCSVRADFHVLLIWRLGLFILLWWLCFFCRLTSAIVL